MKGTLFMNNKKILGFQQLERNLEAMIHEGFIKIGYGNGEKIRIYYFSDLLLYLLGMDSSEKADTNLLPILHEFCNYIQDHWGNIQIGKNQNRYEFIIPAKGAAYVYEKNKNNTFLKDLIEILKTEDCTIDNIIPVFEKYSSEVIYEKSTNPEFDYVVYFEDSSIDPFKYCFTFDTMGKYYHRLTDYDYAHLED